MVVNAEYLAYSHVPTFLDKKLNDRSLQSLQSSLSLSVIFPTLSHDAFECQMGCLPWSFQRQKCHFSLRFAHIPCSAICIFFIQARQESSKFGVNKRRKSQVDSVLDALCTGIRLVARGSWLRVQGPDVLSEKKWRLTSCWFVFAFYYRIEPYGV